MISVLIMSINKNGMLIKCLNSLKEISYPDFRVILCVPPSVREELARNSLVEGYSFVSREENEPYRYSKFANRMVQATSDEYICLLNDDIEPITPDWLEIMLTYLQNNPGLGMVTPKLLFPNGTIQYAGCIMDPNIICGIAFYGQQDYPEAIWNKPTYYSAVGTACALMRRDVYREVGGMEEDLVAFNDIDLSLKVYMAGYRNIVVPAVSLFHHESVTRGQELEFMASDQAFMRKKWGRLLIHGSPNEVSR